MGLAMNMIVEEEMIINTQLEMQIHSLKKLFKG
jgi:hypothetical protein